MVIRGRLLEKNVEKHCSNLMQEFPETDLKAESKETLFFGQSFFFFVFYRLYNAINRKEVSFQIGLTTHLTIIFEYL